MILSELHFFSEALDVRTSVNVILPQRSRTERRQSANAKFRTLYLLHGYSDDHTAWQRWTSIERYVEGKNLAIEWRSAEGQYERLPGLASELANLKLDVFVTAGAPSIRAAQKATTTIPIVMINAGDPVGSGLVASLEHVPAG